jgi:insulysin
MIEFYKAYLHPDSPIRSKLSIQLLAQASTSAVAKGTTAEDQKEKLVRLIAQNLNSQGIAASAPQLQERLDVIDFATCDQGDITNALKLHLSEDLKLPVDTITTILTESTKVMAQALPSLGIEIPLTREAPPQTQTTISNAKPPVIIEDAHEYKARQAVTTGASPVRDLSEFEETEPKL